MDKNKNSIDLTQGSPWKVILSFAFPIFLSNIFQQIYNLTNSFIVGNYVGKVALSAVSACTPVINIYGYIFYGLGLGCGVVLAHYYGAKDQQKIRDSVETSMMFGFTIGIALTIFSLVAIDILLKFSNVNNDIYAMAKQYLSIYFLCNLPLLIYNVIFNICRSFGNSTQTLYYLIISCLTNLILGIIFVRIFHLGVIGVALATVISQYTVAIVSLLSLNSIIGFKVNYRHLKFDLTIAGRILELGIPAGIQNMLIALSSLFIQSYINLFPTEAIAGIGVSDKLGGWIQLPMGAIYGVVTSYVAQNLGAQKYDRIKEGVKACLVYGITSTIFMCILAFIFAPQLVSIFNKDADVIHYGAVMVRYLVFGYIPIGFSHIYNGVCRGAGNVRVPLILAVASQVVFRTIFVYIGLKISFNIVIIYLSGPLCFALAGLLATLYYNCGKWTLENHLR